MSKTIRTYTIAPKSMNRTQLLGKLDPDTRQWHDGVLTTTAIAINAENSGDFTLMNFIRIFVVKYLFMTVGSLNY